MIRRARVRPWAALICLTACGCSAIREIPRDQYAARAERRNVQVETRDGTRYQFDQIHVRADSLFGERREDTEGPFDEVRGVSLALDDVRAVSVRQVDWYRSGLVAGVGVAVVLAAVLSQQNNSSGSGGGGECGARPCP